MKSLLLCFLLVPAFIYCQEESKHPIDISLAECMEKDYSTHGMLQCLNEAAEKWDAELNKVYNELKGMLDDSGKKKLKEAQQEWIKFRDKEFEFLDYLYSQKDGTMYLTMRAADRVEVVRKRALELQSYIDVLKY
ncbi:MAG: lysozyme inhibitor LprI family protein [bacterium]